MTARSAIRVRLDQMGYTRSTALTVFTDGEEALRNLARGASGASITPILDWFHIAMRVQHARQAARGLKTRTPSHAAAANVIRKEVERLHWRLWNGRINAVDVSIARLVKFIRTFRRYTNRNRRIPEAARKLWLVVLELRRYVHRQAAVIVDYAKRHRNGQRVSTSVVESTVNLLINHRMNNQQQMRWSIKGANQILQVRAAVLNAEFERLLLPKSLHPKAANDPHVTLLAVAA